ncbi:MAG: HupE/UreJ family protein [Reichenbachiella sp.]
MSTFELYFGLGCNHILDLAAVDHILFLIALCAVYEIAQWKKVLILITAFTIGHSLTLALSSLNLFKINSSLVESLIPVTIFITAFGNILNEKRVHLAHNVNLNYLFALFFGLIHGMGFSNYLMALLGTETSILMPLFAFNIGIELGQLIIVLLFFVIVYLARDILKIEKNIWIKGVSLIVALTSIYLFINTVI